jgi:hypothetical protein
VAELVRRIIFYIRDRRIRSLDDASYRFESCPDYTLKTKHMELLISILIVTSISTFIAVFWVRGINYMRENHPDYKGEDLFDEDLNKNKQRNT